MENLVRREVVESARTIVVKVGTNVLSRDDDQLDTELIAGLAGQIRRIIESGRRVVVVSSGAVGAGLGLLGLTKRPTDLPHLQASAALGQATLIRTYDDAFQKHGYHAAQMLLTANDFRNRDRYLNVRNTLNSLFEYGAIPIVNENDTVSVNEIKFGDNDRLAAMVSNLLEAPLLVILSVVNGLYNGNPDDPNTNRIPLVDRWDDDVFGFAQATKSSRGTGGMQSKLESVRMATSVGECVIIANGKDRTVLDKILNAEDIGTLFMAEGAVLPAWKRWIGFTVNPKGTLTLDEGAVTAVKSRGKSLLPIGIAAVSGSFERGELVSLRTPDGREFARGLTNYDSSTTQKLCKLRTEDVDKLLGGAPYTEVVHRDNLCVLNAVASR